MFSTYKEKKKLRLLNEVVKKIDLVRQEEKITYAQSSLSIMDDKETGPIAKHGVITISVDTMEVE